MSFKKIARALSVLACTARRFASYSCKNAANPAISPRRSANLRLLKISTRRRKSTADASSSRSSRQDQRWCRIKHRDTIRRMYASRRRRLRVERPISTWGSAISRMWSRASNASSHDVLMRAEDVDTPWTENWESAHNPNKVHHISSLAWTPPCMDDSAAARHFRRISTIDGNPLSPGAPGALPRSVPRCTRQIHSSATQGYKEKSSRDSWLTMACVTVAREPTCNSLFVIPTTRELMAIERSSSVALQHARTSSSTANQCKQKIVEQSDLARSPESSRAVSIRATSEPVYSRVAVRMRWASLPSAEVKIQETSEQTPCMAAFQLVNVSYDISRESVNTVANESHA